jgi:IclR family acetate operon transcriptional repressor
MVRTLEASGFLAYDEQTERYHLGGAMIPAAYLAMSYVGFARVAHPFLERLSEATGETAELTVMSSGGAVVVDQVPSKHPFRINLPIGRVQNSTSMSGFRMHLAFMPAGEQRKHLKRGQPALTPNTVTDPEEIMERMAAERAEGLAYDLEERDLRVCAVSVPVLGLDGHPRAVLSVVAPSERFGPRERKKKAEVVKKVALDLSNQLNVRSNHD